MITDMFKFPPPRPGNLIIGLCGLQFLAWGVLAILFTTAPPLDVVEMLSWGQEWQIGHHKHPPMPAWLAEISYQLGLGVIFGPSVMSQVCILLTFYFVYRLGTRLLNPASAVIGVFLLTGTFYFSWSTTELNHNVVQMPLWAASLYLFSHIWDNPKLGWPWIGLGLLAGFGVYFKYFAVVLYVVIVLWVLCDARLRPALFKFYPWLAGLIAIAVAAPQLYWLVVNDFLPFEYALRRSSNPQTTISDCG